MRRRALLAGLALTACSRRREQGAQGSPPARPAEPVPDTVSLRELTFAGDEARGGAECAVVVAPRGPGPWPLLVALHGRGEAVRGARAGAHGWTLDYRLGDAIAALERGRVEAADLQGFAAPGRLEAINRALAERPYQGLAVVCPHAPDFTAAARDAALPAYGAWVLGALRSRVGQGVPLSGKVGIDGVSMGGRMALRLGLTAQAPFDAVGSLQAAVRGGEAPALVAAARQAQAARQGGLPLRLLTSEGDYFKAALGALHDEMQRAGVAHEHLVVAGPHDYQFNQGPGAIEMLLWHDRVLRGLPGV